LTWDRWHARARLRCSRSNRLRAETEGLSSISRSRGAKVGGSERTTWQRVPKSQTSCSSAANLIRSLQHARARLRGSRSIRLRAVIEGLSSTLRSRGAKVVVRAWHEPVPKSHSVVAWTDAIFLLFARHHFSIKVLSDTPATTRSRRRCMNSYSFVLVR